MKTTFGRLVAALGILALATGVAAAQSKPKVSIAVGGAGCLCYLPTVLAKQLGEYDKAGVEVELIDFKGGSQALQAVIGGSADVVSGYYDHCVNLAAKGQVAAVVRGLSTAIPAWCSRSRPKPRTSSRSRISPARRSASRRRAPRPTSS